MKNPLFIPKSLEKIKEDGSKILYREKLINNKKIRVLKYYNKKGLITRVNVWGICGKLEEFKDRGGYFVAYDQEIDFETSPELKEDIKDHYPKNIELLFL